ncbi:MAG: PAQR family membrane homeostasis protein TrhA [Acidimicrobiia bacterium]
MERVRWGRMRNPMRGMLDGIAAVAAMVGAALLAIRAAGGQNLVAGLLFGLSLMAMFTISSLYHSVDWEERRKTFMRRLDHSMIFLVVAATFTPFGVVVFDGWLRTTSLALMWLAAFLGVALKFGLQHVGTGISTSIQHAMGWSSLAAMPLIWQRAGPKAVLLVFAGGVSYTVGTLIFATKRPRLFPRIFSYHELFHVLVIAGSSLHFLAILWYVMPYPTV